MSVRPQRRVGQLRDDRNALDHGTGRLGLAGPDPGMRDHPARAARGVGGLGGQRKARLAAKALAGKGPRLRKSIESRPRPRSLTVHASPHLGDEPPGVKTQTSRLAGDHHAGGPKGLHEDLDRQHTGDGRRRRPRHRGRCTGGQAASRACRQVGCSSAVRCSAWSSLATAFKSSPEVIGVLVCERSPHWLTAEPRLVPVVRSRRCLRAAHCARRLDARGGRRIIRGRRFSPGPPSETSAMHVSR